MVPEQQVPVHLIQQTKMEVLVAEADTVQVEVLVNNLLNQEIQAHMDLVFRVVMQ